MQSSPHPVQAAHRSHDHIDRAAGCCWNQPIAVALAADIVAFPIDYKSVESLAAADGYRTAIGVLAVQDYTVGLDRSSAVAPA